MIRAAVFEFGSLTLLVSILAWAFLASVTAIVLGIAAGMDRPDGQLAPRLIAGGLIVAGCCGVPLLVLTIMTGNLAAFWTFLADITRQPI
jgi:hypothetical protein